MNKLLLFIALFTTGAAALPSVAACSQTGQQPAPQQTQPSRPSQPPQTTAPPAVSSKIIDAAQLLEDVRALSADAMEGRKFGTPGGARARAYVARRFAEAGLKPFFGTSFEQPVTHKKGAETINGANVVGVVRGKASPERLVVVTAHYDHLGVRDGKIYNGADDNASGVATLLQMAAYFAKQQPAHSLVFAAVDAEEASGFAGSRALARSLIDGKQNVALNVNLDMVSHSDRGELYASGAHHYPSLKSRVEQVAARAPVKLLTGHDQPKQGDPNYDWTNQSDHLAFHEKKITFLYFGVEDHKDYHQHTDDFDSITPDFFVRAAETILDAVKTLDAELANVEKKK
jgi:hypothetical protein